MDWKKFFESLVPVIGEVGVEKAVDVFRGWEEDAKDPIKKIVLKLLADALEKHGVEGIKLAVSAITDMLDGKEVDLDFTDLKTASDALAVMQNAEADSKSAVKDYMAKVSESAGVILSSLVKGLLGSV